MWLYDFSRLTSQYICPSGHKSWKGVEILEANQYDSQQPIYTIFAGQWTDVYHLEGQYHEM